MDNISNVSEWLKSGEYKTQIDAARTKIIRECENSESEAHTASIFENTIYSLIHEHTGVEPSFVKESPVKGIMHHVFGGLAQRRSGRGRLDAVVNNMVIEYKHHSKLQSNNEKSIAFEQVRDYLTALKLNDDEYDAILTDGIKVAYFSFVNGIIQHTSLHNIASDDIDRIICAILNNQKKKFEPANIVKDFAISQNSDSSSKTIASILFQQLDDSRITGKSNMLYSEWKGLMHLSVEDNGKSRDIEKRRHDLSLILNRDINTPELEYKALFALQTTYAIIVKLIACKVVDKLNFSTDTNEFHDLAALTSEKTQRFFQNMEDGYSYISKDIRNFLEGDFFSWYADSGQWSEEFWQNIKRIIIEIDNYSSFSLNVRYNPVDVFKDLYMSIIPQSVRHSMGEYFTPEWLADCVITEALESIQNENWSAIDPCCGSGIFIIALIKKVVGDVSLSELTEEERKSMLDAVLKRVHGIDINPLSVLSARVSYYIAIHQFGDIENVEIPIYLGDSAIVPITKVVDGIDCYSYSVSNNRFEALDVLFPKRFVQRSDFGKVMNSLQALVKAERPEILYGQISECLSESEKSSGTLMEAIRKLSEDLVRLHKNNWDGIWIRITTNFMLIARLHKHDLIVGNPPWVKWEHLPAAYTKKIKEFCDIRHIFCNDGGMYGGAQLNICALISNVAATNWLKETGMLAFLMPDSIMSQNSYEEFRNFYTNYEAKERLYLQKLDRWLAPLRPFKVGKKSVTQDFNTYYYARPYVNYQDGVDVRVISKKKGVNDVVFKSLNRFSDVTRFLEIKNESAKRMSANSTAFTYSSKRFDYSAIIGKTAYLYRTGVESTPFEIFKMVGEGSSRKAGHYRFKNKQLKTSRYKVTDIPERGWDFPIELIYPMVEGPSVKPFSFNCGNNYHVIPYKKDKTDTPITLLDLLRSNHELAEYFCSHRHLLDQQSEKSKSMHRGDEFYALSKIGPYTFAPNIVAARDNSYFCASVITPVMTPWGERKHAVCVKHTIIISQDTEGNFISETEAHYINAILNSDIVHSYIHSTFKTNGFSLNKSNLFIPKFDRNNRFHTRLAILSRYASLESNESQRPRVMKTASDIYVRMCVEMKSASLLSAQQISVGNLVAMPKKMDTNIKSVRIIDSYEFQQHKDKSGFIPLYTLRAACGRFEEEELPEEEGWVDASGNGFTPDPKRHFVVHAKGESMLPKIKDGDLCVFEWYQAGSREGEIVLAQCADFDSDYDGKYTIKRYHSEKVATEEGWEHGKVELIPQNSDYDIIELNADEDYRTIGIFKCVL